MINVNELKIFIDFIANKDQSGNSYSIDQLNVLFQSANIDLFKLRYGLPEDYQPGFPLPRQFYEATQKMRDDLRVCKEVITLNVDSDGFMSLPSDYVHKTAIQYLKAINPEDCDGPPDVKRRPVESLDDDKWTERSSSTIKGPSFDFPIANFLKDGIRFLPKNIGTVEFSYLRIPKRPNWAFTIVDDVEVYDSNSSVDFEWNEILFTDISKIILGYMGINLRDEELKRSVEEYKNKGV